MKTMHIIKMVHFQPLLPDLENPTTTQVENVINHFLTVKLARQNPNTHSWKVLKLEDGVAVFQGEKDASVKTGPITGLSVVQILKIIQGLDEGESKELGGDFWSYHDDGNYKVSPCLGAHEDVCEWFHLRDFESDLRDLESDLRDLKS